MKYLKSCLIFLFCLISLNVKVYAQCSIDDINLFKSGESEFSCKVSLNSKKIHTFNFSSYQVSKGLDKIISGSNPVKWLCGSNQNSSYYYFLNDKLYKQKFNYSYAEENAGEAVVLYKKFISELIDKGYKFTKTDIKEGENKSVNGEKTKFIVNENCNSYKCIEVLFSLLYFANSTTSVYSLDLVFINLSESQYDCNDLGFKN